MRVLQGSVVRILFPASRQNPGNTNYDSFFTYTLLADCLVSWEMFSYDYNARIFYWKCAMPQKAISIIKTLFHIFTYLLL